MLKYIFYRLYRHLKAGNGSAMFSMLLLHIYYMYGFLGIWGYVTNRQAAITRLLNENGQTMLVVPIFIGFFHYFYFNDDVGKRLMKKYATESPESIKRGKILVYAYVIGGIFFLILGIWFRSGKI